jgi:hypothetical protein
MWTFPGKLVGDRGRDRVRQPAFPERERVRLHSPEASKWQGAHEAASCACSSCLFYTSSSADSPAICWNPGSATLSQTWEFYAITGCLFVVLAFPGIRLRYLRKRRLSTRVHGAGACQRSNTGASTMDSHLREKPASTANWPTTATSSKSARPHQAARRQAETHREFIRHPGAVVILPLLDDGRVLLERQFRYPNDRVFIEFPAGKIDPGRRPLAAPSANWKKKPATRPPSGSSSAPSTTRSRIRTSTSTCSWRAA